MGQKAAHPVEMIERAPRSVTTLLMGRLLCDASSGSPCRIRNLSATGMLIESRHPLAADAEVSVELRTGGRLAGRVAWANDGRAGVALDPEIDLEHFLGHAEILKRTPETAPRSHRFEVECPVRVNFYGRVFPARLANLSQGGAHLLLDRALQIGDPVTLSIPGLPSRVGTVRWTDQEHVGISFVELIAFHDLADWLAQNRGDA